MKDFKVQLGGNDTEKVLLPCYGGDDRDETLLIMVKEFNMMIKDGNLYKEEDIKEEVTRETFIAAQRRNKLKAIKETFRKFRACLKGEAREPWINLMEDQPVLDTDNCAVDNTHRLEIFLRTK